MAQDQSLQCLHQVGHESHRPEAAKVFSVRHLGYWYHTQGLPQLSYDPQLEAQIKDMLNNSAQFISSVHLGINHALLDFRRK